MGRYLVALMLTLGIGGLVFAAEEPKAGVKTILEQARSDFQDLAVDLPFGRIGMGRETIVRDRFKDANRDLADAIRESERDTSRSRELTKNALNKFRRVGLLIPFYEIDIPDEAMQKYLDAEDRLRMAGKVFEGSVKPPPVEEVWRNNGLAWKALSGKFSLREAQERCGQVLAKQTVGWHVPSLNELVTTFRALKTPSRNPVFGAEAATFQQVWTGEENTQSPGTFYFVNFQKEDTGISGPLTPYQVVCVGKDSST